MTADIPPEPPPEQPDVWAESPDDAPPYEEALDWQPVEPRSDDDVIHSAKIVTSIRDFPFLDKVAWADYMHPEAPRLRLSWWRRHRWLPPGRVVMKTATLLCHERGKVASEFSPHSKHLNKGGGSACGICWNDALWVCQKGYKPVETEDE